ncbi:MAG TPA: DUF1801 domain-containing protein [Halanaerobiales bacterium]|nr:DUF1801 domain-containing protein [Halanaerobiales bacterium]
MAKSSAETVKEYLNELPEGKREVVKKLRQIVSDNLPNGYQERMNWGMISYEVPLTKYPSTYNKKPLLFAAISAQKNYFSLYLTPVYQSKELEKELKREYKKADLKVNMGKSCLRFKKLSELPLEFIGELISRIEVEDFIRIYEESRK